MYNIKQQTMRDKFYAWLWCGLDNMFGYLDNDPNADKKFKKEVENKRQELMDYISKEQGIEYNAFVDKYIEPVLDVAWDEGNWVNGHTGEIIRYF